jgi:hypothetical protein
MHLPSRGSEVRSWRVDAEIPVGDIAVWVVLCMRGPAQAARLATRAMLRILEVLMDD